MKRARRRFRFCHFWIRSTLPSVNIFSPVLLLLSHCFLPSAGIPILAGLSRPRRVRRGLFPVVGGGDEGAFRATCCGEFTPPEACTTSTTLGVAARHRTAPRDRHGDTGAAVASNRGYRGSCPSMWWKLRCSLRRSWIRRLRWESGRARRRSVVARVLPLLRFACSGVGSAIRRWPRGARRRSSG